MAVPNTNVNLGSIQTEFGGANPISLSEYYRGGGTGYVPSNQTTSVTDGTPISTSGLIRIGMFRGLTKTPSVLWLRPSSYSFTGTSFTSPSSAYDTTATSVDTTTAATLTLFGSPASFTTHIWSGFSGGSSVSGTLYVRYSADTQFDANYSGNVSYEYSLNGGTNWTTVSTTDGGNSLATTTFSSSITVVPTSLRVRFLMSVPNVGGTSAAASVYDIVFVTP